MEIEKKPLVATGNFRKVHYLRMDETGCDGCVSYNQGNTGVISGVNAPRDASRKTENPTRSIIDVQIYEKCGENQGARYTELEELVKSGVEYIVMNELYPRGLVNICTQTTNDDGSLGSVAMNGTMISLLYSGIELKGIVVGICVAGRENNGTIEIVIDPTNSDKDLWRLFTVWDVKKKSIVAMKMWGKCEDNQLEQSMAESEKYASKVSGVIQKIVLN